VESGEYSADNNPLVKAPHTQEDVLSDTWDRPYSREVAVRPTEFLKGHKYWPTVNRIDNVYGDRNLICTCPSIENYRED
jgi:glycine dehydrogenase